MKFFTVFFLCCCFNSFCQLPYGLSDGRENKNCEECSKLIDQRPKEVLFGIEIHTNGDVYFSMSNRQWFDKIFKNDLFGITVDLVSKERYGCNKTTPAAYTLPKGTIMVPLYRPQLLKNLTALMNGYVSIKIGKVPSGLMHKQIEGNLVILNGKSICYYTNFVDIDRSVLQLLPMGLFTDTLIQDTKNDTSRLGYFIYTKRIQFEVPFLKGSTAFSSTYLNKLFDSLGLLKKNIRSAEIRAYSSIEGTESINKSLMTQRADGMIVALKKIDPGLTRIKIITAENWLDFFRDIDNTKFSGMQGSSKIDIKQKLMDKAFALEIEPILAKHRKVVVTLYLDEKSPVAAISATSILSEFNNAVSKKEETRARVILREVVERIMDNKLPPEYMSRLEVPESVNFCKLLNDREVYRYLLKSTSEYEALDNFLRLQQLDPENGKINYNICALRFFMWKYGGDSSTPALLLKGITNLQRQGININLVKRMMINYHILKSEDEMKKFNYDSKDSSINLIRSIYKQVVLNDVEIYTLAQYFAYYSHHEWAEELVAPRVDKINASEDLIFYYINLLFYQPSKYTSSNFRKAVLNAINLNNKRFCNFFLPINEGGAGMQLLDHSELKTMYCESCN